MIRALGEDHSFFGYPIKMKSFAILVVGLVGASCALTQYHSRYPSRHVQQQQQLHAHPPPPPPHPPLAPLPLAYHQHEVQEDDDHHHEHHQDDHIDYYTAPHYNYEYSVHDGHTGDVKSAHESREGDVVKGYYSVKEADGTTREVHYQADNKNGFTAEVKRTGHAVHPANTPVSHQQHPAQHSPKSTVVYHHGGAHHKRH